MLGRSYDRRILNQNLSTCTYSPGGATECTPCKIGTFAPHPGASVCYDCPKGHMCPRANMESEQFPLGTYNDLTRQICCRCCPPG